MNSNAVYAHVQVRKNDVEPSPRQELRRVYRRRGVEFVRWHNQWYEVHVDCALDVYYLILGTGKA